PPEGSTLLQVSPTQLDFGNIPLKSWRIWSRPTVLSIHNSALSPLRWELEIPPQPDTELRVLFAGRMQRRAAGVLTAGARLNLELVAQGVAGPRWGTLTLRSGSYSTSIPWRATAQAGLSVGGQYATRLEDLNMARPDLVPALEALLAQGSLARWLRMSGRKPLAVELERELMKQPDEPSRRLLISRVLHAVDPQRFPLLHLRGFDYTTARTLIAGQFTHILFEIENLAPISYLATVVSHCPWVRATTPTSQLLPFGAMQVALQLSPPDTLQGQQPVSLALIIGGLELQIVLQCSIERQRWWQRIGRLFGV
ncbi:MAG: hypothetical protein HGA19_15650, partial [Oscillochloris sp.]|nr:hypothetical protein [Oscillochloris sp.]